MFSGCFAFNVCNTSVWYGAAILFSNMISGPIWKVLDIDSIDSGFNDDADISTEAKILHKLTLNKILKKTKLLQHLKPATLNLPWKEI